MKNTVGCAIRQDYVPINKIRPKHQIITEMQSQVSCSTLVQSLTLEIAFLLSHWLIHPQLIERWKSNTYVTIICHNDDLSLSSTWVDCLQIDSKGIILFAEIKRILLNIFFIPILLTFLYLVALYHKTELQTI